MNKIIPLSIVGIFVLSGIGTVAGVITENPLDGPVGPTEGYVGVEYTFYFTLPVNPYGYEYYAKWDWGDGNVTDWLGPYPSGQIINASHTWWTLGSYGIRVKLKDTNGTEFPWSDTLLITIIDNRPPNPPIITGPHYGKTNAEYAFFINMTDPDGGDGFFFIDFGDGTTSGWLGPYIFNDSVIVIKCKWSQPGTYKIVAKAKDTMDAESPWSEPFTIYITAKSFLLGIIQGVNKSEEVTILNMTLGIIVRFHPFMVNIPSTTKVLILNDDSFGFLRSRIIVGLFYSLALSEHP
jgi:hypothetical protein